MNCPTVNWTLYSHACTGGGIASNTRLRMRAQHEEMYLKWLEEFFDTTDDHSRHLTGHELVLRLLKLSNIDYLGTLWREMRRLEDQRSFMHKKHTGHAAHAIYLFLLGVWALDTFDGLRESIVNSHVPPKSTHLASALSLRWLYAGLLHDVGYVLSGEREGKPDSTALATVDSLFSSMSVADRFPYIPAKAAGAIERRAKKRIDAWDHGGRHPHFSGRGSPSALLQELDKAPWLEDIPGVEFSSVTEALGAAQDAASGELLAPAAIDVLHYAEALATTGYPKEKIPVLDHGVASGYLLFQCSSFQYWLAIVCGKGYEREISAVDQPGRAPGFSYLPSGLRSAILPACHAASAHNIQDKTREGKRLLPFTEKGSPLLFFSVLCDELQKWHRPPVGDAYTTKPAVYRQPSERDIVVSCHEYEGDGWRQLGFDCRNDSAYEEIYKSLARLDLHDLRLRVRLLGWGAKRSYDDRLRMLLSDGAQRKGRKRVAGNPSSGAPKPRASSSKGQIPQAGTGP